MRFKLTLLLFSYAPLALSASAPDVKTIIQKSVEANQRDFDADPHYNYKERDRNGNGDHTYQVTMIEGSPYQRLIAVNGKPLPPDRDAAEKAKENQARQSRKNESAQDRKNRIAKYEAGRRRDNAMMKQLTVAFNFSIIGQRRIKGRSVWQLKATPKPGYNPPDRDTKVLTGMQGEMWIDQKTFQWVRVTAQVIHPVSIEGFLAQVEPGTRFELEKVPVTDGIWLAAHFSEHANARVLGFFNHNEAEDDTFWDYTPAQ